MSAFGSVISLNVPVDEAAARGHARLFVECLVAPAFSDAAVEVLGRKKNLRVLEGRAQWDTDAFDFKRVRGGFLMQDRTTVGDELASWTVATKRAPTRAEQADLEFAWRAVASVKSNAIVIARDGATIGIGAGRDVPRRRIVPGGPQGAERGTRHPRRGVGLRRLLSIP